MRPRNKEREQVDALPNANPFRLKPYQSRSAIGRRLGIEFIQHMDPVQVCVCLFVSCRRMRALVYSRRAAACHTAPAL